MSHQLHRHTAGPLWGVALGLLLGIAGALAWLDPASQAAADTPNRAIAAGVLVTGVILSLAALRERMRRR